METEDSMQHRMGCLRELRNRSAQVSIVTSPLYKTLKDIVRIAMDIILITPRRRDLVCVISDLLVRYMPEQ